MAASSPFDGLGLGASLNEISRRELAAKAADTPPSSAHVILDQEGPPPSSDEGAPVHLRVAGQRFAVVNIGGLRRRPFASNPCIRFLSAFATVQEAIDYGVEFAEAHPDMSVHLLDRDAAQPFALLGHAEEQPQEEVEARRQAILQQHEEERGQADAAFKALQAQRKAAKDEAAVAPDDKGPAGGAPDDKGPEKDAPVDGDPAGGAPDDKGPEGAAPVDSDPAGAAPEAPTMPTAKMRVEGTFVTSMQAFAAISVVLPSDGKDDALLRYLGVFADLDEAKCFVRKAAAKALPAYSHYVVDLHQFVYPEHLRKAAPADEEYHQEELTRIMHARKEEAKKTRLYTDEFAGREGATMPVMEFSSTSEASRVVGLDGVPVAPQGNHPNPITLAEDAKLERNAEPVTNK
jgi:hypothetical protein